MKTLLGFLMAGGLMLASAPTSHAQVNLGLNRGGSPTVTFGQPTYAQPAYGQPAYGQYSQPGYRQPGYGQYAQLAYPQRGYVAQPNRVQTYSSGYSGYAAPRQAYRQPYVQPSNGYATPYRQPAYVGNRYVQPSQGTGVILNGRTYTLPR